MSTTIFSHSGSIGDVIGSIPAMRTYYQKTGKRIHLKLIKDVPAFYYQGATHPTKDDKGVEVMLNQRAIDLLKPLLLAQDCIDSVSTHVEGEDLGVELHKFRETNVGMPGLSINRWYFYVYPDLAADLSVPWLQVPESEKDFAMGKILITRSERYRNQNLDYSFLKPHEDECVFAGTMREYNNFCMTYNLNIRKLNDTNFLELAQAIKQSKFHITNQTMANQISTGLFHPALLEVCTFAPNCIIFGKDRYDFLGQHGLEYSFHLLCGTEKEYLERIKAEIENKKAAV